MIKSNKNLAIVTALLNVNAVVTCDILDVSTDFQTGGANLRVQDFYIDELGGKVPIEQRSAILTEEEVELQTGVTNKERIEQALLEQFKTKKLYGSQSDDWVIDTVV